MKTRQPARLAGSVTAQELLGHLEKAYAGTRVAGFVATLPGGRRGGSDR